MVGTRPQFIKAAPVSRALRAAGLDETLVHTGQHYDPRLSRKFFDELQLPAPELNLQVGSDSHACQIARMLERLEDVFLERRPDAVLVYGDTNSTLAGALAAAKLGLPLAHVEAGLRSFDRSMPEELNRILTDHASDLLFCPTATAVENLRREGIARGVSLPGDVLLDAMRLFQRQAPDALGALGLKPRRYLLATIHRPANRDDAAVLARLMDILAALEEPVLFPMHPGTRARLNEQTALLKRLAAARRLRILEPAGYLEMLALERDARLILTDSGGVQREAFFLGVPCVTLREATEWVETVRSGWNVLVGSDPEKLRAAVGKRDWPAGPPPACFGDGRAAERIASELARHAGG